MTDTGRERLRRTFTEAAELYDRSRPGYPARMFRDLARAAQVGPGRRVLEIGCGTGQATLPLAARGCRIVAVELGAEMAAVARRRLAAFPRARVEVAAFEDWPLPDEPFDTVLSATAFHWVDPRVRVAKAAEALRPGGALATVATHHVAGGSSAFFAEVQECYERFDPSTPPDLRLSPAAEVPEDRLETPGAERFGPPVFHRYEWEAGYSTRAYLDLLLTYSGHRALPEEARRGLFDAIGRLIDGRHGGRITKRYLTELRIAYRRA
ncbi:class I SAM-dependent methyltransferase [Allonocardiopsis opalescens]|uniref:Methyltransferase family protein n=1 Tax=Allonocardiopsis opalescens TaxID=1144618 RepID=A0A2T0Q2I6_9ACTN|nr:class I SAM-dependent methyltransferase [Allonocardiopsis opalescens]PRX97999.1 methyltransferase family protein [Allonocardiopsis opalescens]